MTKDANRNPNPPSTLAARSVVAGVLKELLGRKGFDDWWEDIRPDDRAEIEAALCAKVAPHFGDLERLDWMQRTKTGVNYNVEASGWGVDYEAPLQLTVREAIDREMSQNAVPAQRPPATDV